MKWSELEAQGVKRCCAHFRKGGRCRVRASEKWDFSWCDKHGPIIKMHTDYAEAAMRMPTKRDDHEED